LIHAPAPLPSFDVDFFEDFFDDFLDYDFFNDF